MLNSVSVYSSEKTLLQELESKEGMGVYSRRAYFREGTVQVAESLNHRVTAEMFTFSSYLQCTYVATYTYDYSDRKCHLIHKFTPCLCLKAQ